LFVGYFCFVLFAKKKKVAPPLFSSLSSVFRSVFSQWSCLFMNQRLVLKFSRSTDIC